MKILPQIKRLKSVAQLEQYGRTYFDCSGLAVPLEYLQSSQNLVYGIFYSEEMLGGFVLGSGDTLRTLEVFARPDARRGLYDSLGGASECTEITCFWIDSRHRKNTVLNTFVWLSLGFCLRRFGNPNVVFGTCSASLAKLYGVSKKAQLIHRDFMNGKHTFIYWGNIGNCARAFWEIITYKLVRTLKIHWARPRLLRQAA